MAVTIVDEPEAITLTSNWPADEGYLETVVDEVVEHVNPYPYDELDRCETSLRGQLNDAGQEAFRDFVDLMGARRVAVLGKSPRRMVMNTRPPSRRTRIDRSPVPAAQSD